MSKSPYTPELREKIAKEYLAGDVSSAELANKYNIPSAKTVRIWAQKYKEQGISAFIKEQGNARYSSEFKRIQERYNCKTPLEVRTEALSAVDPMEYPIPENKRINKYKEKWCA